IPLIGCCCRASVAVLASTLKFMAVDVRERARQGAHHRRSPRLVLVVAMVLALAGIGTASAYACSFPLDFTKASMPSGVRALKEDDRLAFAAHATLARSLDAIHCSPAASGVQWLKAAAHGAAPDLNQQV